MFKQFCHINAANKDLPVKMFETLTIDQYITASNSFLGLITDAEQLNFFASGFGSGDQIERFQVMELIKAAFHMAHLHQPVMCDKAATAVVDAVMHKKETIRVGYFTKWCLQHCRRLVYWMHRHLSHTLSSYNRNKSADATTSAPQPEKVGVDPTEVEDQPAINFDKRPSIITEEIEHPEEDFRKEKLTKKISPKLSFKLKTSPKLSLKSKTSPTTSKKASPESSAQSSPKQQQRTAGAPKRRKSVFMFRAASEQAPAPPLSPEGRTLRSMSVSNLALLSESCALYSKEQTSPEKCVSEGSNLSRWPFK